MRVRDDIAVRRHDDAGADGGGALALVLHGDDRDDGGVDLGEDLLRRQLAALRIDAVHADGRVAGDAGDARLLVLKNVDDAAGRAVLRKVAARRVRPTGDGESDPHGDGNRRKAAQENPQAEPFFLLLLLLRGRALRSGMAGEELVVLIAAHDLLRLVVAPVPGDNLLRLVRAVAVFAVVLIHGHASSQ